MSERFDRQAHESKTSLVTLRLIFIHTISFVSHAEFVLNRCLCFPLSHWRGQRSDQSGIKMAGQGRGGKRESLSLKRKMQIIEEVERNPHKQRKILADCDITISHPLLPQTHTHTQTHAATKIKTKTYNTSWIVKQIHQLFTKITTTKKRTSWAF